MPVLTGVDVLGIQRYIFASSRLRDAVSASWIVHWTTAENGALRESGGDVLQSGGGVAVLRFSDEAHAREFAGRYTRRLHDDAPGLEVVVAHQPYSAAELAASVEKLQRALVVAKLERSPSAPQLGLSVTASCDITGLAAAGFDSQDAKVPLSPTVLRWRDRSVREEALGRWDAFLAGTTGCALPPEIDDMGRTRGDTSLLGVVHVDGNRIGKKIASWFQRCVKERRPDDAVRSEWAQWSADLEKVGAQALRTVVGRISGALGVDEQGGRQVGAMAHLAFALKRAEENAESVFLPIRPVLLGGDDLTFLCDGRIALTLAEAALDAFDGEIRHLGRVNACAGVAIVPAHTPFDRAYLLAESLCNQAKRRRREKEDDGAWIDWHIGVPNPGERADDLRRRAFSHRLGRKNLELTCRPYRLGSDSDEIETWRWLSRSVLGVGPRGFRGEPWMQHRNKLKELASRVREGQDGVRRAREAWTTAARLEWPHGLDETRGFFDAVRTPLLDAVELLDVHLPLTKEADA